MIKVGDKVRWDGEGYEVVLAVTSTHAFVVWTGDGGTAVQRVPLSELTLVESAPESPMAKAAAALREKSALEDERDSLRQKIAGLVAELDRQASEKRAWNIDANNLKAENARLREALQMAVDTIAHNGPDGVSMAAALGIRPSIRHKETP